MGALVLYFATACHESTSPFRMRLSLFQSYLWIVNSTYLYFGKVFDGTLLTAALFIIGETWRIVVTCRDVKFLHIHFLIVPTEGVFIFCKEMSYSFSDNVLKFRSFFPRRIWGWIVYCFELHDFLKIFLSSKYFRFRDIRDSGLVLCRAVIYNNVIIVCIVTLRLHAPFCLYRIKC